MITPDDPLTEHLRLCEELHQLAIEENRFLKQQQRPPDAPLLDRRRELLARLESSLAALRAPSAPATDSANRARRAETLEKAKSRVLQLLHLQRENEQLLLRYSLGPARPTVAAEPPPVSRLQKLYDQHQR